MRRLLATIAIGSVLGAVTIGYAADLDVSPSTLAAGSDPVTACDRDGVDVEYRLAWDGSWALDRAVVRGIDDACIGMHLSLVLIVGGEAAEAGTATVRAGATDDNPVVIELAPNLRALEAQTAHVVIT